MDHPTTNETDTICSNPGPPNPHNHPSGLHPPGGRCDCRDNWRQYGFGIVVHEGRIIPVSYAPGKRTDVPARQFEPVTVTRQEQH